MSRGATELRTIGGGGSQPLPNRTKSQFQRLDDEAQKEEPRIHITHTGYSSSEDSDAVDVEQGLSRATRLSNGGVV